MGPVLHYKFTPVPALPPETASFRPSPTPSLYSVLYSLICPSQSEAHAGEVETLNATKHACLTKIERLRAQRDGLGHETHRLELALNEAQAKAQRLTDDAAAMATVKSELEARMTRWQEQVCERLLLHALL